MLMKISDVIPTSKREWNAIYTTKFLLSGTFDKLYYAFLSFLIKL